MDILLCKQTLKNKLSLVEFESQNYADFISNEIQNFNGNDDYADMVEFCSDYLKTQKRNYFTITAKDTFSSFENADENHTFVYSPLNDHSRPFMHKGDIVFCYRQGQFENLGTALEVRGIYAVGFVLSDPQTIYPNKEKHQKWGVAITIPVVIPNHLELKNIQLHPKTINLTPYNGNRNDALQYIESKVHSQALISLIIARNPSVEKKFCKLLGYTPKTEILPESMWENNDQHVKVVKVNKLDFPFQQIFYGAPGTGKSQYVDDVCKKYTHIRTTFHPDSDYSTFVGCYKPTMGKAMPIYGFDSVGHTVKVQDPVGSVVTKKDITYTFTPQAFTNAYIKAWEDLSKPVFLVIEEINRGNCAQIFGDLFQLLDRKGNGYSSYEIEPNTDLGDYIKNKGLNIEGVKDSDGKDISDKLMAGELMTLPPNLHIWATMNTSDQSLFPIDSAFKRRWDWKYVPINTNAKSGWTIEVNGMSYSWSSFLEKINSEIEDTTSSEDKQLGFFFCKADSTDNNDNNGIISAEKFVSKVLFYLYNDVFKDYGFEREFFKDKDNNSKVITFRSMFKMNGDINERQVAKILANLGVESLEDVNPSGEIVQEEDEDGNLLSSSVSTKDYTKYSVNGVGRYAKNNLAAECVEKYIELHPTESAGEVLNKWKSLNMKVSHFIESKEEFDARTDNSKRSREIKCGDTVIYVAVNGYGSNGMATVLKNAVNQKDWGIHIEEA